MNWLNAYRTTSQCWCHRCHIWIKTGTLVRRVLVGGGWRVFHIWCAPEVPDV